MKKNAMRTIAIWMVLALCLALVPMQAYAEEAATEEQETVQVTESEGKKEEPAEKEAEKPAPAAEENSEEEEPLEEVLSDELVVAEASETGDDNTDNDNNIKDGAARHDMLHERLFPSSSVPFLPSSKFFLGHDL